MCVNCYFWVYFRLVSKHVGYMHRCLPLGSILIVRLVSINNTEWNANIFLYFLKRSSIYGYLQGRCHAVEWNTSEAQQFLHVHAPHRTHSFNVNISVMSPIFDAFALNPSHTITDCGNGGVTDIIYGNPLIIWYSCVHVRLIRYMNVDIRWCPVYPFRSFVHVQNCERTTNGLLSGGCPLIVRPQSILFGTCPLPVRYSCGSYPFISGGGRPFVYHWHLHYLGGNSIIQVCHLTRSYA